MRNAITIVTHCENIPPSPTKIRRSLSACWPLTENNLCFYVTFRNRDGEPFYVAFECREYPLHPPTVEFVSCDSTEQSTKRLYPQGFHSTPCICMRYNRKAYTERGGPHGDWRLLDWRLPSGNGVDNVIAVIAKIHIAATVNFEFIEVVLHPAEDLEYTPASCSRVVLSATSKSRYQLGSTNSGSLGYRPRYCMWSLRTHGIRRSRLAGFCSISINSASCASLAVIGGFRTSGLCGCQRESCYEQRRAILCLRPSRRILCSREQIVTSWIYDNGIDETRII